MAKDPAFLFYSSDFLSGVSDLTMEERGQYITLLCVQHQKGSLSEKTIRLLVGSVSVDVMSKFLQETDGTFFNKRLREEIILRNNFTESRRNNGLQGGRPKKNNKPNAKPKQNHMDNHMEDENINENKDINTDKGGAGGFYPLVMIKQKWTSADLFYSETDLPDLREVCQKILNTKALEHITGEQFEELGLTFDGIIKFIKQDGNAKFYGSFKAINTHLSKIVNGIKNGSTTKNRQEQQRNNSLEALAIINSQGAK